MSGPVENQPSGPVSLFPTTSWTLVLNAGTNTPARRTALAELCQAYWYPLYAFIRRRSSSPEEAEDLTQSFFARLLEKEYLRDVDPSRGRFRAFLLAAVKHFLSNEWDRERTLKRGAGAKVLSIDLVMAERKFSMEPANYTTPEVLYEKQWAAVVLDRAVAGLEQDAARRGKSELFARVKPFLTGGDTVPYREIASELKLNEGTVKVAVHRHRERLRMFLRDEISRTVDSESDIDVEIRHLLRALTS